MSDRQSSVPSPDTSSLETILREKCESRTIVRHLFTADDGDRTMVLPLEFHRQQPEN